MPVHLEHEEPERPSRTRIELGYLVRIGLISILLFAGFFAAVLVWRSRHPEKEKLTLRVFPEGKDQIAYLRSKRWSVPEPLPGDYVEVKGSFTDLLDLLRHGIPTAAVVNVVRQDTVPPFYPDYEGLMARLDSLIALRPEIVRKVAVGRTAFRKRTIWGFEVSAGFGGLREKPAVLFMGTLHAREPAGAFVCLGILRDLLERADDPRVHNWLQGLDIWIVPVVNPDGYDYVIHRARAFPWWRKNLRDNNGDSRFEPEVDGVDLNRNFDFDWRKGGSGKHFTWFYRGPAPASEPEVQAVQRLARKERFIFAIDFHSFGQMVMFPWARELTPPDGNLLRSLAQELARRIPRLKDKKTYRIVALDGQAGQSANWLYARFRTMAFIVEVGSDYFPDRPTLEKLVRNQLPAVHFALDRALGASVRGHVREAGSGKPLAAMIQIGDDFSPIVSPTVSDSVTGFFCRLVAPGEYGVTAMCDGFRTKTVPGIVVRKGRPATVEIRLSRLSTN